MGRIMTELPTREEQHNRLFDQFVKEMFVDPETPKKCKPSGSLPKKVSTRSKWLSKKENLKGPHEERAEMPPLSSAYDNQRGHGGRKR